MQTENTSSKSEKKVDYFLLLPEDPVKGFWDIMNIFFILFVCITAPARIAYSDHDNFTWTVIGVGVDLFFFVDMGLNFVTAYYDKEYNLVTNRKVCASLVCRTRYLLFLRAQKIAKNYLTHWFAIDFLSILPIQLLMNTGDYNSLARIARFPKIYRLVKITR